MEDYLIISNSNYLLRVAAQQIAYGWFYKLALLYFEAIFEVKVQVSEGVMRA